MSRHTVAAREGPIHALWRPIALQVPDFPLTQQLGLVFTFYDAATNSHRQVARRHDTSSRQARRDSRLQRARGITCARDISVTDKVLGAMWA